MFNELTATLKILDKLVKHDFLEYSFSIFTNKNFGYNFKVRTRWLLPIK